MQQNTTPTKEKIIDVLRKKGPSLPVYIAREINTNALFTSAFLSELFSEKKINISNMKVGNSPVYYLQGQEVLLEKYADYLKNKEKEAFLLLKRKKFIKDIEQEPAIRVALRAIKDFAIPFRTQDSQEIIWRHHTNSTKEYNQKKETSEKTEQKEEIPKEIEQKKETLTKEIEQKEENPEKIEKKEETTEKIEQKINVFDKKQSIKKETKIKTTTKRKIPQKKDNKFFNKVKEYLSINSIEILDIENFSKNDLFLRIRQNQEEKLLVAFNKKRITESEIIKANKKAEELNLKYILLSLGEPLKKLTNFIEAVKNLSNIEKIK